MLQTLLAFFADHAKFFVGFLTGGGLVTAWKVIAGWQRVNLSVQLDLRRTLTADSVAHDLVCSLKLKKGDRASLRYKKIEVSILVGETNLPPQTLSEIYSTEDKRFLNITPGEESHFSVHWRVPKTEVCKVTARLYGRSLPIWRFPVSTWQVSDVSVPFLKEEKPPVHTAQATTQGA